MKKALVVLFALAFAGALYAADAPAPAFVLSGAVKTGVQFMTGDGAFAGTPPAVVSAEDGAWKPYNDDAGKASRLEIVGTYADGPYGIKFRLRSDDLASAPAVSYMYAYGDFIPMVGFKAGLVDDGSWNAEGDAGYDFADGKGIQILVKPMKELNLGVKFDLVAALATTEQFIGETAFGGRYTTDLFNVSFGYKMDSDVDDTATALIDADGFGAAYFGVNFKGVKGLTAKAEAKLSKLGAFSDVGLIESNEVLAYAVDAKINVGMLMFQVIDSTEDVDMKLTFRPWASYMLNDKATAKVEVGYMMQNAENSDMYLKPSLAYVFNGKAKINSFLKYDMAKTADVDLTNTTVQVDFIYSF